MHKEITQIDIVKCKQHPQFVINYLFCKQNCPYPSRLACAKCMMEYKTMEGFQILLEVLNDPKVIMNTITTNGIYCLLNNYFNIQDQDPEDNIFEQILKLEQELKEGIEKYKKFRAEIAKVQQQFNEALGREQFIQTFKDILKLENYHQSQEWQKLEEIVQNFVLQFDQQSNQELNEAYYKLKQMEQTFQQPQLLINFKVNVTKSVELLQQRFQGIEVNCFSTLCEQHYCTKLIQRITENTNVRPNITLLFKASQHGMNARTFWQKCNNKGPTLIICKSKSGYVFGGYTPLKWIQNGGSLKDKSKTSFVFSYTRNEIYPITTGEQQAIYCDSNHFGPIFGNGDQIQIKLDFQDGYSNMNGKFYSNESYKIDNPKTHLMGGLKPELVEMEVFLLE